VAADFLSLGHMERIGRLMPDLFTRSWQNLKRSCEDTSKWEGNADRRWLSSRSVRRI